MTEPLISARQLAKDLQISYTEIQALTYRRINPIPHVKLPGRTHPKYFKSQVIEHLKKYYSNSEEVEL